MHSVCSVYGKTPDARCTLTLCNDQCASLVCSLGDESETRPGSGRYELVCAHSKLHTAKIQKYKIQKHKLQKYKLVCAHLKQHTVQVNALYSARLHCTGENRVEVFSAGRRLISGHGSAGFSPNLAFHPHTARILSCQYSTPSPSLGINSPEMFSSLFLNNNYDWILR